ncbi:unnamed protein product [Leuciscus chuanchicus]
MFTLLHVYTPPCYTPPCLHSSMLHSSMLHSSMLHSSMFTLLHVTLLHVTLLHVYTPPCYTPPCLHSSMFTLLHVTLLHVYTPPCYTPPCLHSSMLHSSMLHSSMFTLLHVYTPPCYTPPCLHTSMFTLLHVYTPPCYTPPCYTLPRALRSSSSLPRDCFQDAFDRIPVASKMDLRTSIEECTMALNLVLNNKFSEALDLLKPWSKDSMYHALGYSSIMAMQATMTFEHKDIQTGMATIKDALQTCQRFRKRNSVVGSISSLLSKQPSDSLRDEEMHAEICYAECLLQKATLTFVQDENMISFIKGGIKVRTSYQIYKDCQNVSNLPQGVGGDSEAFRQFEGGVKLGIGSFNLMLSLLPARILRLLEFIGFSGNREFGLSQLRDGAGGHSLRSILCVLTLLFYHTYVSLILGTGEGNLVEAEALLEPYIERFPRGSIILFYSARIALLRGNFEKAVVKFQECIATQQQWRQVHHLCYWELMWCHSFQQQWTDAYRYADLLCRESRWSKAIYVYQKAAILSMMSEEEVKASGESIVDLFRQVEGLKQRLAGKSIPTEKFAVRKSRRYSAAVPVKLVIPALEMMYVWNGFTIVGKRADYTESLLVTIERAEEQLRNDPNPSEFHPDDQCLVQMLKGLCLKHLGRLLQAELCFTQVISSEKRIRYDHYLIPFSLFELGLLFKQQGDYIKATRFIEEAKHTQCAACLGPEHAESALTKGGCLFCDGMPVSTLRSRLALASSVSDPAHLPSSAPREPRRKKRREQRRPECSEFSECTPGLSPRASPTPSSPVLFSRSDQRPSSDAAGLVSFGGSAEGMDDAVSVAASESEDWSGSADPVPPSQLDSSDTRANIDTELFRVMSRAVNELGLDWVSPAEPPRSRLDEWFLPGRHQAPRQRAAPFLPEVHEELTKSWRVTFSARTRSSASSTLSTVDGAEEKGYVSLPPLEEAVAAHLCPPTAGSWRSKTVHPSKPCRTTSAIASRAYAAAGQAASALHAMATLQVFQAKLLRSMDESGPDPDTFKDLRSATDLALRATKTTAQALGRNMASLVVLERHLWLNLTEIRDADKTAFLDSPVTPSGLFGPSVSGFAERFTEAQKASSAMKHFLPKRSSSAQRRPKSTPRPERVVSQVLQPRPVAETSQHPKPAKRFPFPKRQGPRPKLTLDHEPKKPS